MNVPTFHDELEALRAEFERERLAAFDPMVLLALAAFPEWTDSLATTVWSTAGGEAAALAALLERLETAGLAERREVLSDDGQVHTAFWLPASKRADVGQFLQRLWSLEETFERISDLADALPDDEDQATPAINQWLRVARYYAHSPSGAGLIEEVENLLLMSRSTEALCLVAAAQTLGDVLGEPLLSAARRAHWRIDRGYRETMDTRSLVHYLARSETEYALLDLIAAKHKRWALHLLGDGGVGKTMTIRDLASGQFARRHGLTPFPVARIDFDHLDPRYPDRRPAELLVALGTELTSYVTTRASEGHRRVFEDEASALHEILAVAGRDTIDTGQLDLAADTFAEFLESMDGPVVLILDTCEELAKLYGPGRRATAIDQTFAILERVHRGAPNMRALFAGRRWLTPPPDRALAAGLDLSPRDYLKVVKLGGFCSDEANYYLDTRDPQGTLSAELRSAVLARATRREDGEINPFELAGYCDWAIEEPGLDAERLRCAPGDPYVQQRIIDRVPGPSVRDCLPVAVELGRFNRAMIVPYLKRRNIDPEEAFSGLVSQEWVATVAFDPVDGRPQVIEVDPQLVGRLRAAIEANPTRFPHDRVQLGRDLADLVATTPVEDLAIETVEGALRLLPIAEAARMWARFEERITEADAWGWANQAIPRTTAVEIVRERAGGPTVIAHILATQAAAALRQPGRPGLAALWQEVVRLSARHPLPDLANALLSRGRCGLLAATPVGAEYVLNTLPEIWHLVAPAGSISAVIDAVSARNPILPGPLVRIVNRLCDIDAPEVAASALLARAASRLAGRDHDGAARDAALAESIAESTSDRRWTDWVPPSRLVDRARLARAVVATISGDQPAAYPLDHWRRQALGNLADIDTERLVAATITFELGWHLVDREIIAEIMAAETYVPQRQPNHHWHRHTSTLCATAAEALAAAGDFERAVDALRERQRVAINSGEDPTTPAECDAALVALCRRFRAMELISSVHQTALDGPDDDVRASAWAALALVGGESPANPAMSGGWRGWWRAQIWRPERGGLDEVIAPPMDQAADPIANIDRIEFERTIGRSADSEDTLLACMNSLAATAFTSRAEQSAGVGAIWRASALLGTGGASRPRTRGPLPTRFHAETVLAEGELLAMRSPDVAVDLLSAAADLFAQCGDEVTADHARVLCLVAFVKSGADLGSLPPRLWPRKPKDSALFGWARRYELVRRLLAGERILSPLGPSPECDPSAEESEFFDPRAFEPITGRGDSSMTGRRAEVARGPSSVAAADSSTDTQFSIGFNLDHKTMSWSTCGISISRSVVVKEIPSRVRGDIPPSELPTWLAAALRADHRPYIVVPLVVPDERIAEDWEQRFGVSLSAFGPKMPLYVRFRHTSRGVETVWRVPRTASASDLTPVEAYFFGPRHLRAVAANFEVADRDRFFYLVGTPVRTSVGWRLRVEDTARHGSAEGIEAIGRGTNRGERLINPEKLASPAGKLVVIQAEPIDGPPHALGRLREGMCRTARGFRDHGSAVLVVPPLPDKIARRVVTIIHEGLGGSAGRSPGRVLDTMYRVRSAIAEMDPEPAPESASHDVLLFV